MVSLLDGEMVVDFADLALQEQRMLRRAKDELVGSHHPYSKSGHSVASVVWVILPDDRSRYYACTNFEVRPRSGACAEDAAIFMTHAAHRTEYAQAICVIDENGDGSPTEEVPYPCPVSRGAIAELAQLSGLREDFPVILSTTNFDKVVKTTIGILLPHAFDYP